MTGDELRALPFGAVVWAMEKDRYYRKGRNDTWHRIRQVDGQRSGQQDAVRSAYLQGFVGTVTNTTAETERLRKIKERRNT